MVSVLSRPSLTAVSKTNLPALINQPNQLLKQVQHGKRFKVCAAPNSLLIICHQYYAEVVGAGAMVGGVADLDCDRLIPIGQITFKSLQSSSEKQQSCGIRTKWIEYMQTIVSEPNACERSKMVLKVLSKYCGVHGVNHLPDELLAQIAGVEASTMAKVRRLSKMPTVSQNQGNWGEIAS